MLDANAPGFRPTHWQAMCLFAFLISLAFGFLSRRGFRERMRYAIYAFLLFLLIAAVIGWLMYPVSH